MKLRKIAAIILTVALLALIAVPAGAAKKQQPGPLENLQLVMEKTLTLEVGAKMLLEPSLDPAPEPAIEGTAQSWKTSASKIATVSKTGTVTAKKPGKAKITLTLSAKGYSTKLKAVCTVTVVKKGALADAAPPTTPSGSDKTPSVPQPAVQYDANALAVIELTNRERAAAGLSVLKINDGLMQSAALRAREIETLFSHTRPDGTSWSTLVPYASRGENIAYTGQRSSPEYVISMWMGSQGHRKNILRSDFTHIGVGVYYKGGTTYWVQNFAKI